MSKKWRIRISLLLCVIILYSLPEEMNIFVQALGTPLLVRAEELNDSELIFNEFASSGQPDSWDDGAVIYTRDNGTLTVSGSGVILSNRFKNDMNINKVIIGAGITSIGENAFFLAKNIKSVEFEAGSQLTTIGNNAFNSAPIESINLPSGLQTIGDGAFATNKLTTLKIPSSVTSIGVSAFNCSYELRTLTFASGGSNIEIKSKAFYGGGVLESIVFPDGPTTIGDYAFADNSLTQVTIPANVTSIGDNPFSMNSQLTVIQVDGGNPNYEDRGSNAIIDKYSNTLITGCKNTNIPYGVTRIGNHAFKESTGLTSVTIPDSVTGIGDHAFDSCTGLTSVTIPDNVNSIGEYAFAWCYNLSSVTIPEGITNLKHSSFYKCINLTQVAIPNSVTQIDNDVFLECKSLRSIIIPNQVTNIGTDAFKDCESLTKITIQGNCVNVGYTAFDGCAPKTLIFEDGVNQDTIKKIINNTLMDTSKLVYLVVPDSMLAAVKAMEGLSSDIKSKLISRTDYDALNKDDDEEETPKKKMVETKEEVNREEHIHNYTWYIVHDVTADQDGIEELRCSCGDVKERSIIPVATYVVKGLCDAIQNSPTDGTVTFDSLRYWCISDYIIKRLDERKDVTTLINFEYNHEKYLMTIPAGRDYTKLLTDEDYFYGYFGFESFVPGVKIEKVQ